MLLPSDSDTSDPCLKSQLSGVASPRYPLYRNRIMSQILYISAAWHLDHVCYLADEVDFETRVGRRDDHVVDEATKDCQGFISE